jgi:C-methyltransferase C-terminal domain/Putative zinc binding domain/Methyltransferase domain
MYTEVGQCRICGNHNLALILDLGVQALTGVFPKSPSEAVEKGPLQMVKCTGPAENCCGLLQLHHSFDSALLYGESYGYRSGLNAGMVRHLQVRASRAKQLVQLHSGDLILDVGSNDGTLLRAMQEPGVLPIGMDPLAAKFRKYYSPEAVTVADFFTARRFRQEFPNRKARIVTSVAMFYDLERPMDFVRDVLEVLADDGIWVFEQSYLPTMLKMTAYDTVCHEHSEYYSLRPILWMLRLAGLKLVDVELNAVNGGSICLTAAKTTSSLPEAASRIAELLREEETDGIEDVGMLQQFQDRVDQHRFALLRTIGELRAADKRVSGYGASTKGNVILQYCGLTSAHLDCIADVNSEKFGAFTPGTLIPIVSEADARSRGVDVFLVFPWHFRDGILDRERDFLSSGGAFLFPLPEIAMVRQ